MNIRSFFHKLTGSEPENDKPSEFGPLKVPSIDELKALQKRVVNFAGVVNDKGKNLLHCFASVGPHWSVEGFDANAQAALDAVAYVIDQGADVNLKDRMGLTPLAFARSPEMIELLVSRGANPDAFANRQDLTDEQMPKFRPERMKKTIRENHGSNAECCEAIIRGEALYQQRLLAAVLPSGHEKDEGAKQGRKRL